MSVKALSWAFDQRIGGNLKLLLLALADCHSDGLGRVAGPDLVLANVLGQHRSNSDRRVSTEGQLMLDRRVEANANPLGDLDREHGVREYSLRRKVCILRRLYPLFSYGLPSI